MTGHPQKFAWFSSTGHTPISPLHNYCEISHLSLLNLLPPAGLSCFAHRVCEITINPLVMAPRSRKSARGRFFFFSSAAHVLGSASWLNHPRVRNLFHFKQDPLIAEALSQITSIQSSESRIIGKYEVEKAFFSFILPNIFFQMQQQSLYKKKVLTLFLFAKLISFKKNN